MTILVALGKIATAHTRGTIYTEKAMHKLLDYGATHYNATLRYKASRMVLKANSDVSHLSE